MEIGNFIVIDGGVKLKSLRTNDGQYSHTINGSVYFPIEVTLPIIQKGVGCIGVGFVKELRIRKSSTTVIFEVSKVSDAHAEAYYSLYRNQVSTSDVSDPYEQQDVIIPGMMGSINKPASRTSRSRDDSDEYGSLSEYMGRGKDLHW